MTLLQRVTWARLSCFYQSIPRGPCGYESSSSVCFVHIGTCFFTSAAAAVGRPWSYKRAPLQWESVQWRKVLERERLVSTFRSYFITDLDGSEHSFGSKRPFLTFGRMIFVHQYVQKYERKCTFLKGVLHLHLIERGDLLKIETRWKLELPDVIPCPWNDKTYISHCKMYLFLNCSY